MKIAYMHYDSFGGEWTELQIKEVSHATIFFVAQPKSAVKKISILIKTRRSAATSCPPPPPIANAQSPKHCPCFYVAVKIARVEAVAVA